MMRLLNRLFNIRPDEWPRLLILYLMAFLFIAGITWGEKVIEASFLFKVGVQFLPLLIVIDALISIVATAIYTPFVDRASNQKLLIAISTISLMAILIGRGLLALGLLAIAYPMLYILTRVVRETFNLQWWTYVNGFYDTRSAKRIIPLLATASRIAIIVAGWTLTYLNLLLPPDNIIFIWVGTLAAVAFLAWLMPYLLKQAQTKEESAEYLIATTSAQRVSFVDNLREGYRYVFRSPYLRWMAISTLLVMMIFAFLLFEASRVLSASFESEQALSNFTGRLDAVASLILLPFQLFLFSRLVGRIGLGNANLLFPMGTLAICGALIALPSRVATAALGYLDRTILRTTFRNPTHNLLYNAVPLRIKGRARAFISGLVAPIGLLIGGALLIFSLFASIPWFLPLLIGVSAIAYVLSDLVVRKQYTQALISMLEQEDFSFLLSSPSELAVTDSATLNWLTKKLEASTSTEFTIFMAKLISEVGGDQAVPILKEALQARDAQVRSAILDILVAADIQSETVRELYVDFLDDPDPQVRHSAIVGLERLLGPTNDQFLTLAFELTQDPDIDVRARVIPPLIQSSDFFYLASAAQTLSQLLIDRNPQRRVRGVRLLGQSGDVRFIRSLVDYLTDDADEVRLEAAIAIETLAQAGMPDQTAALALKHMRNLLDDPVERVRQAALITLGRINNQEAHRAILPGLTDSSLLVRETAVRALVESGQTVVPLVTPMLDSADLQQRKLASVVLSRIRPERYASLIETHVNDNLLTIYQNHNRLQALAPCAEHPSIAILQDILRERNEQLSDEIFYLLSAIHAPEAIEVITDSLDSDTARVRANAVEALESLTTPRTATLIGALFEPESGSEEMLRLSTHIWQMTPLDTADVIRQLIADPHDSWLRTIVTFALGEIGAAAASTKEQSFGPATENIKRRHPLDALIDPAPDRDDVQRKTERQGRRRRVRPANLLDALSNTTQEKTSPPDQATVEPADPSPSSYQSLFTRPEIEAMLEVARTDPVADVRIAAQAAGRMIAGLRVTEVTSEEDNVLSTIEKIIFLKEVPFFQGMTIDQLKVLANICEEELFPEDTRIFSQNDPGGALYVVVSGRVAIEREGARKGSYARLATIEAHSYFGEMTLFDNSPRSATARAIQDTMTLRLRREPLIALARQYPDLSLELINVLSQRLRESNDRIALLTRAKPSELHKLYDKLG